MLRERSARRRTEAGEGARQEERDKDPDRDRDRRSETRKALPGREKATREETKKCPTGRCCASQKREGPQGNRVRKCAFIQSRQEPFAAPGRRERGRLGCARLGTGTNSSLPCSGRFSSPVRDFPIDCKGAGTTSLSKDKEAKRVRRDPSLRGKGVARVSPPGPACGGASPPGEGLDPKMPGWAQVGAAFRARSWTESVDSWNRWGRAEVP
ncbi:uncharacterized protein LOC127474377 [Manacus candei]|uniref:uncharacterized protein LOC127474377 n=1 Tax=Manacus candei TaxID=415023 RepID=UPI0022278535|nr:uncharacterized protein LOC127474377 [Manacus candei]